MGGTPPLQGTAETQFLEDLPSAEDELAAVRAALKSGDPHTIMDTLVAIMTAPGGQRKLTSVITELPATTFSEFLRLLDPKHFIGRDKLLHMEISPSMSRILGLEDAMDQDGVYTFLKHFLDNITLILELRNLSHELIQSDYKLLLRYARATAHVQAAKDIWANFSATTIQAQESRNPSKDVDMKLDVESYNDFLGVMCWHDIAKPHQRHRLRFVPRNFAPRAWPTQPYTLAGHAIAEYGIKYQATRLFRQMVNSGLSGNEETFCLMMVALGREGDVKGVASILKRVWSIDVEALTSSVGGEDDVGSKYSSNSPFYPSGNLLFTIAHVYGINNSIPTALRLVDFVSRQYSIPIPLDVWNELLQRTFALSVKDRRSNEAALLGGFDKGGNAAGALPQQAVLNLWNTMVSEPYNVKPTMEMYNRLIRNLAYRQRWGEMQTFMAQAQRLHNRDCSKLYQQQTLYNLARANRTPSRALVNLRTRDITFLSLRVARNKEYIRRWLSLLLLHGSRSLRGEEEFATRVIPQLVNSHHTFLKRTVRYHVRQGLVEFGTKVEKKRRMRVLAQRHAMTDSKRLEGWVEAHWAAINKKRTEGLAHSL